MRLNVSSSVIEITTVITGTLVKITKLSKKKYNKTIKVNQFIIR